MSSNQELKYHKISDLIKDSVCKKETFDGLVFDRTRNEEIIEPIEGTITGTIPDWIKGSLIQNGPGAYQIGDVHMNHLFDGMALLHRYNIENGKVTYQCRFVQSDAYKAIKTQNKMAFSEFGTTTTSNGNLFQKYDETYQLISNLRCHAKKESRKNEIGRRIRKQTFVKAWFAKEKMTDNTSVTVYPIDQDMFALTETPLIYHFNPDTLETLERHNLSKSTGIIIQPAHAMVWDGKLYNCGTSITGEGSHYVIFCVPDGDDKFNNIKVIAKVPSRRKFSPSYMHSFGITENYFIIIEQPYVIPAMDMKIASYTRKSFCETMKWLENEHNYVYLVDRTTGDVMFKFETEQFMYFHMINQFEKDGHVVFDLICYKDGDIVKGLMLDHLKKLSKDNIKTNMLNSRPLRFVLPLNVPDEQETFKNLISLKGSEAVSFKKSNGSIFCAPEMLYDGAVEFGTVWYEKYMGKPYRYFYNVSFDVYAEYPGQLIKVDTETKTQLIWKEANAAPNEPIFVPAPDAKSEDDGVVVASVLYGGTDTNRVTLLVLDAKTFKELGRCEFKDLSDPVPRIFHGWFVNGRN